MIHRHVQSNSACQTEQLKTQVQDSHTPEYLKKNLIFIKQLLGQNVDASFKNAGCWREYNKLLDMLQWKRILTSNSFCVPSEEAIMFMLGYML